MKIIEALDKKVGKKIYLKYKINLPKKLVKDSGLLGKEIKARLEKGKIILEEE